MSNFSSVDSIHSFPSSSELLDFADFRATDRRKSRVWQTDLPFADSAGCEIWGSARSGADRCARMGQGIDASILTLLFSPRITSAQLCQDMIIHSFPSSSDLLDFADFRATDRRKSRVWQTDLPFTDSAGYGIWGSARSGADRGARMGRGIDASIPAPLFSPRITLAQLLQHMIRSTGPTCQRLADRSAVHGFRGIRNLGERAKRSGPRRSDGTWHRRLDSRAAFFTTYHACATVTAYD